MFGASTSLLHVLWSSLVATWDNLNSGLEVMLLCSTHCVGEEIHECKYWSWANIRHLKVWKLFWFSLLHGLQSKTPWCTWCLWLCCFNMDRHTFLTCTFHGRCFQTIGRFLQFFSKLTLITYLHQKIWVAVCGFSPPPNPPCCTFCPEYITKFMAARTPQGAGLIGCDRPLSYPLSPCRYIARLTDQSIWRMRAAVVCWKCTVHRWTCAVYFPRVAGTFILH